MKTISSFDLSRVLLLCSSPAALAALRDTLLPKLLSGELIVAETQ